MILNHRHPELYPVQRAEAPLWQCIRSCKLLSASNHCHQIGGTAYRRLPQLVLPYREIVPTTYGENSFPLSDSTSTALAWKKLGRRSTWQPHVCFTLLVHLFPLALDSKPELLACQRSLGYNDVATRLLLLTANSIPILLFPGYNVMISSILHDTSFRKFPVR